MRLRLSTVVLVAVAAALCGLAAAAEVENIADVDFASIYGEHKVPATSSSMASALLAAKTKLKANRVDTANDKGLRCGDNIALKAKATSAWWSASDMIVNAKGATVADQEQFVIHCNDREVGDRIFYGDSVALENLHNMGWIGDGQAHLKVKMRASRPSENFDVFLASDLNARTAVSNGDTVMLRNPKVDRAVAVLGDGVLGHERYSADPNTGKSTEVKDATLHTIWLVCPSFKNKVCNDKGVCENNKCKCFEKFEGKACHRVREYTSCHSVGDPHWKTFDDLYFNLYSYGEYLQYFNPRGNGAEAITSNLVRLSSASIVSVNRGVAMRRFKEIVAITWPDAKVMVNCKDVTNTAKQNGGMTTETGIKIFSADGYWHVISPTQLKMQVATYEWGQNLFFTAFEPKDGQLQGLCGNFNGNPRDDVGYERGFKEYDQPNDKYVSTIFVPAKYSLLQCATEAYTYEYFLSMGESISVPALKLRTYKAPSPAITAIQVAGPNADPLDPDSRARVNKSLASCKGSKENAEKNCASLLKEDEGKGYPDCIEDQCETGEREFVTAAANTVKKDDQVSATMIKDGVAADKKEQEQEQATAGKRRTGAPDALDQK